MKKIVFSLLVFSSIAFGQVNKNLGDFDKVTSFDKIDVMLIPSSENKIVIDGKEANEVELVNKNGELKIRMPFTKILSGDDISVTLYFKKINAVEANEGSRIACGDLIKSTSFEINAKEGSEIKLYLETQKLSGRIANGSNVKLTGNAINQDILVNSGGIYEAENLKTEQTTVTCNAGGQANIFATVLVDAKVRAGGEITIYGKPKEINQKVIAGGTIREAK
ncbi:head GIN domain-containing protein [Flavobacterium capsici]|uniref:Head GIN domain-containing protein n=1 Tax=Flavobacterium capsici TaxID=3075618 RepID=A0AA96J2Z3_9FLAO|nr:MULTISPECIES: head GIN domain-containing protein [unclassified Flavobacterium]WNM19650.1 head GIN domain-containing protein [Flavobacterium sp. PMR2A8]WNM21039.1 head GIN domain-containing protein [Flavobacterium sp. PMTSA4]